MNRHLIRIQDLKFQDTEQILNDAKKISMGHKVPFFLSDPPFVVNLFLEPSTRTRTSFEIAQKKLGLRSLNFQQETSSFLKGESVYDTLRNLQAMGVKAAVLRTSEEGLLQDLQSKLELSLVNAGDGTGEHPTQALLDLFTIQKNFTKLQGLKVAIVGDIEYSRVAHSHQKLLPMYGIDVIHCSMQDSASAQKFDEILPQVDVLMLLRVQKERHKDMVMLSNDEYHQKFGLTLKRYEKLKKSAIIMHPGPYIRGMEIASELVECEKSRIFQQVESSIPIRMSVMNYVLGGSL